ncbi:hypothetical protein [Psychroserpens jangbogonensis]|uniref:hypothetical protein n=1 Tax=Psychroserpens jangbogonensis TaxID=1484460 RepID=UPI00053E07F2|nr:hypothetical protein [Psychroserpens jangbogonensis]
MVEDFTKAIVREIGRNYGKAISNQILGDAHSTPYRRVGETLGAGSGGRNYENLLDKLISTFIIRGKVATFNSAQNIYNAFFNLVNEAKDDGDLDLYETSYLIQQYYRALFKLDEISKALLELDAKDKSQMVLEKIISMNAFMKSLDENFERLPLIENEISKSSLFKGRAVIVISLFLFILMIINLKLNVYELSKTTTLIIMGSLLVVGGIFGMIFINSYNKRVRIEQKRLHRIKVINEVKELITKASNSIEVSEVEVL